MNWLHETITRLLAEAKPGWCALLPISLICHGVTTFDVDRDDEARVLIYEFKAVDPRQARKSTKLFCLFNVEEGKIWLSDKPMARSELSRVCILPSPAEVNHA